MEEEIEKLKKAILFLTRILAMNEARENRDRLGPDFPNQFEREVELFTKQIEEILN